MHGRSFVPPANLVDVRAGIQPFAQSQQGLARWLDQGLRRGHAGALHQDLCADTASAGSVSIRNSAIRGSV
jgi:hypothetical protein